MGWNQRLQDGGVGVLIVQGSRSWAERLKRLLQERDYRVVVATGKIGALAAARSSKPSLIIFGSIAGPKGNLHEVCGSIRSDDLLNGIPIIFAISLSDPEEIINGLACGADGFILKSFVKTHLFSCIDYVLKNRKRLDKDAQGRGVKKRQIPPEQRRLAGLLYSAYKELDVLQKECARLEQSLAGLSRVAEGLNAAVNEQDVANIALERAMDLPGVRAGWVVLRNGRGEFYLAARRSLPPALELPGAMEGDCLCRQNLLSGKLDYTTNIVECDRLKKAQGEACGLRFHVSIPLWIRDQRFGLMNLAGSKLQLFSEDDLKMLHGVGNQVAVALERAQLYRHLESKVEERTVALSYQATHDALTGLPNRALLCDRLQQAILIGQRENKPVALLLLDLNRFKDVNDSIGHDNGDLLLQQVGPRLKSVLREADTFARLGGDEFAALLSFTDVQGAVSVVEKILTMFERPFIVGGITVDMDAGIGIAVWPDHGSDVYALLQRADIAMYVAKESGKGYAVYSREQDQYSPRRLALAAELRQAIEADELCLHYQPKVALQTGRVTGVEVLVRWRHPQYGTVPPDQFIPLAERTGLIRPLTFWVLRTALNDQRRWNEAGMEMTVSVNLSARSLLDPQLPDQVGELLKESGSMPSILKLEITESVIMADPAQAMRILSRLSNMGVQISIDDFGTGYSSLGYLNKLPVDEVKIDKSFVLEMATDDNNAVIVRSVIDLGHNLGLKVVAEGVENEETCDRLATFGCDEIQGYYIARPMPSSEIPRWLEGSRWWGKSETGAEPASS